MEGSHTHTVTDPGHNHAPGAGTLFWTDASAQTGTGASSAFGYLSNTVTTTATATTGVTIATAGVSGTNANLPPYYALCYIMKT